MVCAERSCNCESFAVQSYEAIFSLLVGAKDAHIVDRQRGRQRRGVVRGARPIASHREVAAESVEGRGKEGHA